ncbi:MAG: flagellar filament capping protein FliD [Angelakisella sp.]
MVGGIYGNYSASRMQGTRSYLSAKPAAVNNFDYKAAQQETKALLDRYKQNGDKVKALKADTAKFLDDYQSSVRKMGDAANAVKGSELDRLLYGKSEAGMVPTDENVEKTAAAVAKMVEQFNSTLTTLNKNAERGPGVSKQIGRMVSSPTSDRSMELVGITTNKDGTLKVDMDTLKKSLKENTKIAREVIGGSYGIAQGISRDSVNGLNQSPISLVGNDVAAMKQEEMSADSMEFMSNYSRTGAVNMMNLNSVGLLMNMII